MKRIGWYSLSATVAAFALGSLLLLAANLYVQSHCVQQRIRATVQATLKVPIALRKTTITPWGGLRLDGITLRGEDAADAGSPANDRSPDFFTAGSFRVRFAWWPLITRQHLVIESVLLDQPDIVWQQDSDGDWSFPPGEDRRRLAEAKGQPGEKAHAALSAPAKTAPPDEDANAATPNPTASAAPSSSPGIETRAEVARGSDRTATFPLIISKLRVRHGEVTILDRDHVALLHVDGMNSDGTIADAHHAKGAVWFAKASTSLPGVSLRNYWTAVDYGDQEGLVVRDGRAEIAGGMLKTDFRLQSGEDGPAFSTSCKLENVALGRLTQVALDQPPLAEGFLQGSLDCRGNTDDPSSRRGGGRLSLVGAKLRDWPLLKFLGQALRISDLSRMEFKQAEMDYQLDGTVLHIAPLILAANDVRITMQGSYLTDQDELDLHGRLTIDQAVSHQLPQFIESNFTSCGAETPGCRYLDFDVTGTASEPKSNLYDRLTAGPMKSLLDNLLAPKPKNPRSNRRSRESGTQASPPMVLKP